MPGTCLRPVFVVLFLIGSSSIYYLVSYQVHVSYIGIV